MQVSGSKTRNMVKASVLILMALSIKATTNSINLRVMGSSSGLLIQKVLFMSMKATGKMARWKAEESSEMDMASL
jgi:hypothetical protein